MGLGNGLVGLFKQWGKGIGNAADNFWLGADAQKAIRDEVTQKFKPKIDLARRAESRRANNIKDLDTKVTQSKQDLADAQAKWQAKHDSELAAAQTKRQTDIANYNTQSQAYQKAVADANASRDNILDQLRANEVIYDPYRTIFTDVRTGDRYILNIKTGDYEPISTYLSGIKHKKQQAFLDDLRDYDNRLIDIKSNNKVINAFDKSDAKNYDKYPTFNGYKNRIEVQDTNLRNAENEITRAKGDLKNWQGNNSQPQTWGKRDLNQFKQDFEKNNGVSPTGYSFNGQKYKSKSGLDRAYKDALTREENRKDLYSETASRYASRRDAEIAQRIQDAKDINKAKAVLGGTLGAGALYAGARAMYGGDNTDNTDNTNNTDYGKPDPNFNIKNTPEVQAQLNDEQQPDTAPIDTGFDPDKADALAAAAYDKGVEDGNSIESSGDLGNNIAAKTGGHTIDDKLFELLKAMENPYKADAIADYIYSRYGDNPDVQRLGWRGWLNKYYGDSLRSSMNIDPSGYKGMHIA